MYLWNVLGQKEPTFLCLQSSDLNSEELSSASRGVKMDAVQTGQARISLLLSPLGENKHLTLAVQGLKILFNGVVL